MFSLIIVDDEQYMLEILKKILNYAEYGFELTAVFANPDEAIEYIDNNKVDVVMTDISMPGVNGIDIAKHCFYHHPKTTVIFLSAFTDFEYARKGIQYKVFSYITNPSFPFLGNLVSSISNYPFYKKLSKKIKPTYHL